ncbi:MAG: tRNA pseudouridine synthase 10 [Candidatus Nanohaloarchaea archaeon]|jgi:tRNA pseudouridine synthase 10
MKQQEIREKAEALLQKDLCNHCLGRQFAQLGHGLENYERAAIIRKTALEELSEESFDPEKVPEEASEGGECQICQGVFNELDHYTGMVIDSFDRYQLETFLVGIRPPEDVVRSEEDLWEDYGIQFTEPIKTELSRLIGKKIEDRLDILVDFERADIMAVIDMREGKERVELQVNSILFYAQYNKYSREIPQTEWHCRKCRGSGCDECDWTGKQYPTSVQEEIQDPFIRESNAIEAKFHGNGREDVDAKCLGKREFVLELIEPLNRDLDVEELQKEVNESSDKVEIFELEETYKDKVEEIKETRTKKEYRAKVRTEEPVAEEDLEKLKDLEQVIEQETPERVKHRRADKIRERKVHKIDYEVIDENTLYLYVRAEAGTYIKELIHGDDGRTQPNVSETLGTNCECLELDITWVEKVGNE